MNTNNNSASLTCEVSHIEGLPNYADNQAVLMTLNEGEGKLMFRDKMGRSAEIALDLAKLNRAEVVTEEQLQKSNVLKRAVIGKMLFGSKGAKLGAISGARRRTVAEHYYVITYTSNNQTNSIVVKPGGRDRNFTQFDGQLKAVISSKGGGQAGGGAIEL